MDLYARIRWHQSALYFKGASGWSIPNTLSKTKGGRAKFKVSKCNTTLRWHEQNQANHEMSERNVKANRWWANYDDGAAPPFSHDDHLFDIQIISVGLLELVAELANRCKERGIKDWMTAFLTKVESEHIQIFGKNPRKQPRRKKQIPDFTTQVKNNLATIMVKVHFLDHKDAVIVLDLRKGYGRRLAQEEADHLGTHPDLLKELSEMESFEQNVRIVRSAMDVLPKRGLGMKVAVVCIDCNGTHASVGFSELLFAAVQLKPEADGKHLCSDAARLEHHEELRRRPLSDHPSCGISKPCKACNGCTATDLTDAEFFKKSKALTKTVELWHGVEV